jgi:hypothetical protein
MAYAGQILENAQSGERFFFRKTAADTGGEYMEFDLELQPDGKVPGKHVHPKQEEQFEVRRRDDRSRPGDCHAGAEDGRAVRDRL